MRRASPLLLQTVFADTVPFQCAQSPALQRHSTPFQTSVRATGAQEPWLGGCWRS